MARAVESLTLIVGLGNPGKEFSTHRHNVGFQVVDALASAHGLAFSRRKGRARVAEGRIKDRCVVLAKPQTFMNQSGRSVRRLSQAYKIPPERTLVVYDDLDLPLGRLRMRPEGGSGGHRGMRSILESMGTQGFARLRVGIDRPPGRMDPADYVLEAFGKDQQALVDEVLPKAVMAIECWLEEGIVAAMDRFNQPSPPTERDDGETKT
jgi:PTH1 family peptidyl-tRNA hydrolase